MHICARVNTCPHFVITLDQDTDLHSSRLGRGSSCKEVMSSSGQLFQVQEHQEWLSSMSLGVGTALWGQSCRARDRNTRWFWLPRVCVETARITISLAKSMPGTWWLHCPLPLLLGPGWGWQNILQDCHTRGCTERDTRSLAALTWRQTGPPNSGDSPKGVL